MTRRLGNIALVVASMVIALTVFELVLRLIGFSYPNFYVYDDYTGLRHRAGAEGWFTREGKAYVRINTHGWRDREHALAKPKGTFRIAVLGDSFAEALQVPAEEAFWSVLERDVNSRSCGILQGKVAEVINFGVSGFGTAQQLVTLERHAWKYSPDLVLLAFFTGNDVRNNSRQLEWEHLRPFFSLQDGQLVLDSSFVRSGAYRLRRSFVWRLYETASRYSRTVQMLVKLKHDFAVRKAIADKMGEPAGPGAHLGLDIRVYVEPGEKVWTEAWDITERIIARMRNDVQARGMTFLLVSLSNPEQVNPDKSVAQKLADALGVKDLFYPERRLEAFASRESIATVSLAPSFREYAHRNSVCLHGFENTCSGHWNSQGHRLAGELMAKRICEGRMGSAPHVATPRAGGSK